MTTEPTARTPIPVDRLIGSSLLDDGADFDDCLMGYHGGTYDTATGILTLRFDRDTDCPADDGDDWGSATYRFRLIPDRPEGSDPVETAIAAGAAALKERPATIGYAFPGTSATTAAAIVLRAAFESGAVSL